MFVILLIAGLCFALGLLASLRYPGDRPVAAARGRLLAVLVRLGLLYGERGRRRAHRHLRLGTLGLDHWIFRAIGAAGLAFAVPFNEWAMRALSDHQTLGLQGELITSGPYGYSRNPQYVAEILTYLGVVLITNSLLAAVICALVTLWFLLAPRAEEPWLAKQFGEQFEDYCRRVPRFLGPVKKA